LNLPKITQRQLEYQNPYQQIFRVTADFGEYTKEYFVSETGRKAGVVAVRDGHVLLVRQYRFLINGLSWEIPGGKVEDTETPAEAAVRECLEETGVRCQDLQPLVFFHAGLDTRLNPTHIFQAGGIADRQELEMIHDNEASGHEWVPLARCLEMVFGGAIQDSFSMLGIMSYHVQLQQSQPD
jgi:8-oxo-dGTP pyrophosphatase MutT (NUDIX family)